MKRTLTKFFSLIFASLLIAGLSSGAAQAQEAPDALVKRLSQEILELAKNDKDIQAGNQKKVYDMVESKILPHIDFPRMTSLAAGKSWKEATPEQQKQLTNEFRTLLVFTYSGAISQIKDQRVEFKPMRADPGDTEVEVRTQVIQSRGEPVVLNYRLEKLSTGWKIFDINVLGAWLVETYKGSFSAEISKSGIDGLIKVLADKNKKLAASSAAKAAAK
ncbi:MULTISPECIES: MlaC/ttg2D family ABC transporter substrate-binding protein [Undibacterium]|jgi:phospholipid transport system substrate-binding protein|uniref:ABC transporter substrate-binding protein n=1 Tax=Undibacterium umbellatum TaxID=2762300 RepID=A0ABR6ZE95_9BURK|nr:MULTISPECIES: ABC transporter substrate-binding protein [Undibacterium]MBC3910070.1 ABC transporter substrate-binding protein [Undibacterium umbellatum]MDP1979916.1 ABC transporter substrate-binding protein [Undibacterium sp.]